MTDGHNHNSSGNLKVAFFLNVGFTILEIIGGFWTNSIAILTDAIHDLADSISLGLAWYFDKISTRERTAQHTYGYRRFRLLGGMITGVMLLAGLGFVLYHAIGRLADPTGGSCSGDAGARRPWHSLQRCGRSADEKRNFAHGETGFVAPSRRYARLGRCPDWGGYHDDLGRPDRRSHPLDRHLVISPGSDEIQRSRVRFAHWWIPTPSSTLHWRLSGPAIFALRTMPIVKRPIPTGELGR